MIFFLQILLINRKGNDACLLLTFMLCGYKRASIVQSVMVKEEEMLTKPNSAYDAIYFEGLIAITSLKSLIPIPTFFRKILYSY